MALVIHLAMACISRRQRSGVGETLRDKPGDSADISMEGAERADILGVVGIGDVVDGDAFLLC